MGMLERRRLNGLEWVIGWLGGIARRRGRVPALAPHLETGERGEMAAFFYLRRLGFTVVARRWNDGPELGDLDLIGWQGETLCFIEVKTRSSKDVVSAAAAVDRDKRNNLRRQARQYLRQLPEGVPPETRFDIVTVYELPGRPREIRLIAGAFGWRERRD